MKKKHPWKIVHVDLGKPILPLTPQRGYMGLFVVWWFGGIPLGQSRIDVGECPISPAHARNLGVEAVAPATGRRIRKTPSSESLIHEKRPLSSLKKRLKSSAADRVSVVVCTRNRPDQLQKCLSSLQKLSPPPLEIIVVDNDANTQHTHDVVSRFPDIGYLREPRLGLSVARNSGIRHAHGDIIAFTDDDAEAHRSWAARLQAGFADPDVKALTGLVLPATLDTEAQTVFEWEMGGFGRGFSPLTFNRTVFQSFRKTGFPAWRMGAGANMAFRREVFDKTGYFDERLGPGAAGCGDDSELWYRILASGEICRYEPAAVVYHHHRESMAALKQQMTAYMRGHTAALLIQFQGHGHRGNLRRLFVRLPRYYAVLILEGVFHDFQGRHSLLRHEIKGCFSGIRFYLKNRKRPR